MKRAVASSCLLIVVGGLSACSLLSVDPVADFTISSLAGEAPLLVSFDASSSYDPNGSIVSYHWDFGDGATATGVSIEHTFAATTTQIYTVTLTVTDDAGATATSTQSIEVFPATLPGNNPPTARFTVSPTYGNSPLTVQFDASLSSDVDGSIELYAWNFGDGSTGSGKTLSYTFEAVVTTNYTVTLMVTDDAGATGSTTAVITVMVTGIVPTDTPTASFTASDPVKIHQSNNLPSEPSLFEVSFDPSASTAAPGGHYIKTYLWNFGDGETLSMTTDATFKHTYELRAQTHTFVVTLTVIDEQGLQHSAVRNVTVTN